MCRSGRIQPGSLPGGQAALLWHVGPYHELQRSHLRLTNWVAERGFEPNGGMWEVYWTDPGLEPDPSKWKTQIIWPTK